MKKILFLLAFLPMLFLACSSDDDNNKNPMCGTKWYSTQERELYDKMYKTSGTYAILDFFSHSYVKCYIADNNENELASLGTYKYEYSEGYVTIYETSDNYCLFKISGNEMNHESGWVILFGKFTRNK